MRNYVLHYPVSSTVTLLSRNRKERDPGFLLQLWKNQEVFILRVRMWSNFWEENNAGGPFEDDLQESIRHPHRGSE